MEHPVVGSVLVLLLCAGATPVAAQEVATSFEQLAVLVKPGDKISVADVTGAKNTGRLATLSADTLTLLTPAGPREVGEADVSEIRQRRDDSLKNGAIIGAVAGTAYFVTILAIFSESSDGGGVIVPAAITAGVIYAGLGAAAGAGIDALFTTRQVIYRKRTRDARLSVSPIAGGGRRGAALVLRF